MTKFWHYPETFWILCRI